MESLLSSVPLCSVLQDIFASSSRFCFPIPPSSSHLFFPPLLAESYRPSHPIFLPVYSKYSIYLKQFTASGLHRCHRKCCLRSRDQVSTLWGQFPVVPLVPSAVHPCLRCMMQEEPWGSAVYMAHHAALRGQRPELCITCGCPSTRVVFLGCGWGWAGLLLVCGRGNTAEGQLVLAGSSWLILSLKRILFLTTNLKFAQKNLCRAYIFLKKWWTATSLRLTENSDMESVFI